MIKIAIVGAPGTGKTVLARKLTNTLQILGYNADQVVEYVRTYLIRWVKPDRRKPDLLDQVMIFIGQKRREDDLKHVDFVICDSATFLVYVFTHFRGVDLKDRRQRLVVNKMWRWTHEELPSYDLIFYLPPSLNYRAREYKWQVINKKQQKELARQIEAFFELEKIKYFKVAGNTTSAREKLILKILAKHLPKLAQRLKKKKSLLQK